MLAKALLTPKLQVLPECVSTLGKQTTYSHGVRLL
jgi:hypothetical protein